MIFCKDTPFIGFIQKNYGVSLQGYNKYGVEFHTKILTCHVIIHKEFPKKFSEILILAIFTLVHELDLYETNKILSHEINFGKKLSC